MSTGSLKSQSRSTSARALASSVSLSINMRVASIKPPPHFVVLGMSSKEPDCQDPRLILHASNQSIVIPLDVENNAAGFQDAPLRVRCLDFLRVSPFGAANNIEPGL